MIDREYLVQIALDAMLNKHDMDVRWETYAEAAVDAVLMNVVEVVEGAAAHSWDGGHEARVIAAQFRSLLSESAQIKMTEKACTHGA